MSIRRTYLLFEEEDLLQLYQEAGAPTPPHPEPIVAVCPPEAASVWWGYIEAGVDLSASDVCSVAGDPMLDLSAQDECSVAMDPITPHTAEAPDGKNVW
jgi:hypothetical protein